MQRRNFHSIVIIAVVIFTAIVDGLGQDRAPAAGFKSNASYSISDIENVSMTTGNLMLDLPIASLPAGRGSAPGFAVSLHYNSKLWAADAEVRTDGVGNNQGDQYYTRDLVTANDSGGWIINSGGYSLKWVDRFDLDAEATCAEYFGETAYQRNAYRYKMVHITKWGHQGTATFGL